ncbi:MAG: translocation/assembly module TamB domain-containing protein [Gammaproteobacteria bacterium]|nr:translocation/assembly module TamB domain-containing protein [Gammaproteobacteria bacterium]
MKRLLPAIITFALLAVVAAGALTLLYTESGLRWVFAQIQRLTPGQLTVEGLEGRLAGPLIITGLGYDNTAFSLRIDRAALHWKPGRLFDGRLVIDKLELGTIEATVKPGPRPADQAGAFDIRVPVPVDIQRLTTGRVTLSLPEREPAGIDSLEAGISAEDGEVRLAGLRIAAPRLRLELDGDVPLNTHAPLHLSLRGEGGIRDITIVGDGTIDGPWRQIDAGLHLTQPLDLRSSAHIDTGLGGDTGTPRWQVRATAESFVPSALFPQVPAGRIQGLVAQARGDDGTLSADGELTWDDPRHGSWSLALELARHGENWEVPRFRLAAPDGTAELNGNAELRIVDGAPGDFTLDAHWQDLTWPPTGGIGATSSPRGALHASGTLDDYTFTLNGALIPPHVSPLDLSLTGRGDRAGVTVPELSGAWLDGAWSGQGELSWSPILRWEAALAGQGVNPAVYRKDFDGQLEVQARVRGDFTGDGLTLGLDIDRIEGTLRDYPLALNGRLAMRKNELFVDDLRLRSGAATLDGSARLGAQWRLEWKLHAPELAALHPDLDGALDTEGNISGPPGALRTRIELNGRRLAFRDMHTEELRLNADIDLAPAGQWNMHAEATGAGMRAWSGGRITLDADGNTRDHHLRLAAERDGYRIEQSLNGSLQQKSWQARLHDGRIVLGRLGAYDQEATTGLTLAPESFALQDWCWRRDASRLCLSGAGTPDGQRLQTAMAWRDLDLADLSTLLPVSGAQLGGAGTGELRVEYADGRVQTLEARAGISGGTLSYSLPDEGAEAQMHTLSYHSAALEIGREDDNLRSALRIDVADGTRIDADLRVPDWYTTGTQFSSAQPFTGRVDLDLNDLSLITLLAPSLLPGKGHLHAGITLSGSFDDPRVDGQIDADLATLAVTRLGLSLHDLSLRLQAVQNRWRLDGGLTSGEGRLRIEGDGMVRDRDTWAGTLTLNGERVEIVRLPSAEVTASPAVTLRLAPGDLEFGGTLTIPSARIEPFMSEPATKVSGDVVIVGRETAGASDGMRIHGDLIIIIGDQVRVSGKGLDGRLAGRLRILMNTPDDINGQGEIRFVEGRYRAYGQNLNIEQGRALYAGGQIDNPALDIIAARQRGDDIKVGVRVTGTAEQPLVRLFSEPVMDDGDALSYLILGRPLDQASTTEGRALYQAATSLALVGGEALATRIGGLFDLSEVSIESGQTATDTALVLGKSLSPRLYVRYIRGLVENTAAFQIRYKLNDKWTLETESGTSSGAGIDLIYSFER